MLGVKFRIKNGYCYNLVNNVRVVWVIVKVIFVLIFVGGIGGIFDIKIR